MNTSNIRHFEDASCQATLMPMTFDELCAVLFPSLKSVHLSKFHSLIFSLHFHCRIEIKLFIVPLNNEPTIEQEIRAFSSFLFVKTKR